MATCPSCQREVQDGWKFCRFCGQGMAPQAPPEVTSVSDYLPSEVLARHLEPKDMQGILSKTLEVEEGQLALLFVGGRNDATLGPGKHSIGNILTSRGRDATAVLFQTSDVSTPMSFGRLLTKDPLPLALDCRLVLKVDKPLLLWENLANGAESYNTEHLAAAVYPLVEEGTQNFVGSRTMRELDTNQGVRLELQMALALHLNQALARWGLAFVSVQAVSLRSEIWDKVTQSRTDYVVAATEQEVALEGRKRFFDVHQESEIQTLAEETARVAGVEKRLGLWERMRKAVQANARGEIQSQAELEDLVRHADRDRLLKDDQYETLARTVAEAKEDHGKARAFLLRRVEAEGEHELRKLDLGHRFGLEQERLTMELSTARREMEAHWELDLAARQGPETRRGPAGAGGRRPGGRRPYADSLRSDRRRYRRHRARPGCQGRRDGHQSLLPVQRGEKGGRAGAPARRAGGRGAKA